MSSLSLDKSDRGLGLDVYGASMAYKRKLSLGTITLIGTGNGLGNGQ